MEALLPDSFSDELLQNILSANMDFEDPKPYLEILLQPKQRGYRFRYSSEGKTHGGIPAESSIRGQKTFPTVQIANYTGRAAICVSLVTVDDPPKVHAHNLEGKDVKNGFAYIEDTRKDWRISFQNLGIQHVTKKDLVKVLHEKLCQQYQLSSISQMNQSNDVSQSFDIATLVDSFGPLEGNVIDESVANIIASEEKRRLENQAKQLAKEIDLSAVRLCFQAFLPDENGQLTKCLPPVCSQPIYDQKAAHAGQLKICRISCSTSSVEGDQEIYLLCDKVQKEDIFVRFFEEREDQKAWEAYGKFSQGDVHKQCAIVLKTPPYIDKAIQTPVTVSLQLKRGKDNECSPPIPFTYKPLEYDKYKIGEKRRKGLPDDLGQMIENAARAKQAKSSSTVSHQHGSEHDASNLAATSAMSASDISALNSPRIRFFSPDQSRR